MLYKESDIFKREVMSSYPISIIWHRRASILIGQEDESKLFVAIFVLFFIFWLLLFFCLFFFFFGGGGGLNPVKRANSLSSLTQFYRV